MNHPDYRPDKPHFAFGTTWINRQLVLVIVDLFSDDRPTKTVTNGIEGVLEYIFENLVEHPDVVVYCDTLGTWDQVEIDDNRQFVKFSPLRDPTIASILNFDKDDNHESN